MPLCPEILDKLNILWDGTVIPCCYDIDGTMRLGTVFDGVDAVWRNDRSTALRTALFEQELNAYPVCAGCKGFVFESAEPMKSMAEYVAKKGSI
jgi:radical SAM protein with 4Fe4S-binding SPASM domain